MKTDLESTADSSAREEPDVPVRRRLARLWLTLLAVFCGIAALAGLGRLAAVSFGFLLTRPEHEALLLAIGVHAASFLTFLVCGRRLRGGGTSAWPLRLLAIASPLLLLVSVDRWATFFIPPPLNSSNIFRVDRDLGWAYRPNTKDRADEFVTINSRGLRGPDVPYEKPPEEFRVVLLGDSVAFGPGIALEDTFARKLERMLGERMAPRQVVVVNTAVSGYSPWQQLLVLKREGLRYDPDLVIQCFCLNDVAGKFELVRFGGNKTSQQEETAAAEFQWSGLYRLAKKVHLAYASRDSTGSPRTAVLSDADLFHHAETPRVRQAWRETLGELGEMAELCSGRGIRFAIVVFPFDEQLNPKPPEVRPQDEVRAFCEARKLPCLDLLGAFYEWHVRHEWRERLLFDWAHLNEAGHALAAERIVEFLVDEHLAAKPEP